MSPSLRQAPLFHPRLRKQSDAHAFPSDLTRRHDRLRRWIASLRPAELDEAEAKEARLHGELLAQVFGDALGYQLLPAASAEAWQIEPAKALCPGGKSADYALGFFRRGEPGRVLAAIALAGAKQPLDHASERAPTPVQQAWDHATHVPGCRWILVSNARETRLYSTARTPDVHETFLLEELDDLAAFKRFYFILARENLLPRAPDEASPTDRLLAASARVEAEITRALYEESRALRKKLYVHLGQAHPGLPALERLGHAQTILDRILFIAFAQDRGLLPRNTLANACALRDPNLPRPLWENFQSVFRWIDEGNAQRDFPAYNGGLFRRDTTLDRLEVPDALCEQLNRLARYDFREEVSVDVLGHIFEQSIADLEELRAEALTGAVAPPPATPATRVSKRRAEGIFYTPAYITRFIVDRTLGRVFDDRWQAVLASIEPEKRRANERRQAWIDAWEAYRTALESIRVLDPACGSGAFLVAAFDALAREHERVNAALAELRGGQVGRLDPTRTVLDNNLFGVDLSPESVEITRLSLWLKTAERGRKLTCLDGNIKWGDSIIEDPAVSRFAFDWTRGAMAGSPPASQAPAAARGEARWKGGFDVVIGNPPYVRQEMLRPLKEHLESVYETYHGMADLFVYFFERGLSVLKPGGRLGFIVANKWLRSGYAAPLRRLLAGETRLETLVDFGHAPIFPDADTSPCLITLVKPEGEPVVPAEHALDVTSFPRERLREISLPAYVANHRHDVPQSRLGAGSWGLEPPAADALYQKIRATGIPLEEFAGTRPYRGIVTGCNDAFLITTETRDRLVREAPGSAELFTRYLRGQDIRRWAPEWDGLWMIRVPWGCPIDDHPAVLRHLEKHRAGLEARPECKQGRFPWYAMSRYGADFWHLFAAPKLFYQVIQFHPAYAFDDSGLVSNDKCFFLPSSDGWLLAVLNSPLMWWFNWRYLTHMKDEALTPLGVKMAALCIARPTEETRAEAERIVPRLIAVTREDNQARAGVLDSLRLRFDVETPGQKLEDFARLSSDELVAEVLKRRPRSAGDLKAAALNDLRAMVGGQTRSAQVRQRETRALERRLAELVNEAYGLTREDVALLWSTAPPRMPATTWRRSAPAR